MDDQRGLMEETMEEITSFGSVYRMMEDVLRYHISIKEVRFSHRNIAGLKMREFREVVFHEPGYSLFVTPYSFDHVLSRMRYVISLREKIKMLEEQFRGLEKEFRKASQRINLYEQRLIPRCKEAVRRINVHLQDQQAAAVGVAKTAKMLGEEGSYY